MLTVSAIILAAGEGKRFGQPKWQATYQGETFLSIILERLSKLKLKEIICVVCKDSIPGEANVHYVINEHPEHGMISSIYAGVQNAADTDGFLIFPVDHPFVSINTLEFLFEAFKQHPSQLVRPNFNGQNGHPIMIPSAVAKTIPDGKLDGGLKQFLLQEAVKFYNVLVDDDGILSNINTKKHLNSLSLDN